MNEIQGSRRKTNGLNNACGQPCCEHFPADLRFYARLSHNAKMQLNNSWAWKCIKWTDEISFVLTAVMKTSCCESHSESSQQLSPVIGKSWISFGEPRKVLWQGLSSFVVHMAGGKIPKGFRIEDILSDKQDFKEDSPKHETFAPFVAPNAVGSAVSGKHSKSFALVGKVFKQICYCLFFFWKP